MAYLNVTAAEFKKKLKEAKEPILIDVRAPEEKVEGDIEGSVLMNMMEADFPMKIEKLDKSKEYFLFCRSGGRSASACEYMNNLGFQTCYNLEGGIRAWNNENEVEK